MEFSENKPIYLQIANNIYENILLNQWLSGDKIPAIREYSIDIEVNPNTVMRAYNFLQEKGIIFKKRGIGYFVADHAFQKSLSLKRKEFINKELPEIFKTMKLLKMEIDDLKQFFNKE